MGHSLAIITTVALCTIVTRAFPFFALGGKKEVPGSIRYLGKVLPPAIMAILVMYCLKNVNLFEGSRGIPELASVIVVVSLHLWKRSTLLSIGLGTVCYMILIRIIL